MDCAIGNDGSLVVGGLDDERGDQFWSCRRAAAIVTWPGAEVAATLDPGLAGCSLLLQSCDSRIFELGDCFVAQSSAEYLCVTAQR